MAGCANAPQVIFKSRRDVYEWPGKVWEYDPATGRFWSVNGNGLMDQYWHKGGITQRADGKWETPQQDGFAGRHYAITLRDGREVVLRGPWHGGTQPGWNELSVIDTSSRYYQPCPRRPWHKQMATFGLYITDDLLMKAIARFQPHVRIALVHKGHGDRIEPFESAWGAPKGVMYEAARQRAVRKEAPGSFDYLYSTKRW
jgi:hypothetical protein